MLAVGVSNAIRESSKMLAGTAAAQFAPAHGAELEPLVRAGLGNEKSRAAATSVPARYSGLDDRGRITTGLRAAALLLVAGDPTEDIRAPSAIVDVWRRGVRRERP